MDDNLYWLMLMWSICETLYLYGYSKMFLVRVHVRTHMNIRLAHVLVDWLRFTSHRHGDVKLIMWAHVRHEIELTQHEMMTSHYQGFFFPTAPVKPPPSGSGLPDRFDRKPVDTGWIQIQIQNRMCNQFWPVYRPFWPVYQSGLTGYRSVWVVTGRFEW